MSEKLLENLDELYSFLISILPGGKNHDPAIYTEYYIRSIIEKYYGIAISLNNINAIALLNLFIRANQIKVNKLKILDQMYSYWCREEYSKIRAVSGTRVSF